MTTYKPEFLMVFVLLVLLGFLAYASRTHNDPMAQWTMGLAAQAFAAITTLIVSKKPPEPPAPPAGPPV